MKETDSPAPTPEQLLQLLGNKLSAARPASRLDAGRRRPLLLVGGVLFIVIAAAVALFVLEQMLGSLKADAHSRGERPRNISAASR